MVCILELFFEGGCHEGFVAVVFVLWSGGFLFRC